jgi:DNA-binding response OmpR family regulator
LTKDEDRAMRILLVEDDRMLGDGLQAGLTQAGYAVDWLRDGEAAVAALSTESFAAVVLDLGLPKRDGLSVLKWLRGRHDATPVLILTARDQLEDRVRGLDLGADDYVLKPFDLDEIAARLRALVRRAHGHPEPLLTLGEIELNPAARTVTRSGQAVELTPREFELLHLLLQNNGHVLTRRTLEEQLYTWNEAVDSNALEVHIHHLRRKLGNDLIRTVRGVGYMTPTESPHP